MADSDLSLFTLSADVDIDATDFANTLTALNTQMASIGSQLESIIASLQSLVAVATASILTTAGDAVNGLQKLQIADAITTVKGDLSKLDDYTVSLITTAQGATEQADATSAAVDKIDKAAEKGAGGFDKMEASAKKTWKAVKQVASDLWSIGVALVEVAADVDVERRRFNMAFLGIEEAADEALEGVSAATGIHSGRLRMSFAEIQTQMMGAGYEGAEALAMTTRAMMLAADAAALYGMDVDDATSRVLSFMRGNLEAGDAIGVLTSAAARDEYVESVYGRKWKELSELEKQAALLQMMEEQYAKLEFTGAAAKFSDSYLNAYANIKSAWRDVRAGLGEPLMKAVAPVLQTFADWIAASPDVVDGLAKSVGLFFTEIANGLKSLLTTIAENPDAVKEFVAGLSSIGSALISLLEMIKPIVDWLSGVLGIKPVEFEAKGGIDDVLDGMGLSSAEGAERWQYAFDMIKAAEEMYAQKDDDTWEVFDPDEWAANAAFAAARDLAKSMLSADEYQAVVDYIEGIRRPGLDEGDYRQRKYREGFLTEGAETFLDGLFGDLDSLSSAIEGLPGVISAAMNGMTVQMDGVVVGQLVAPTVMGVMARKARNM